MSELSERAWWRWTVGCGARGGGTALQRRSFALPGDQPHWPPDRVVDVKHIRIDVSFDIEARKVFGRCATTFAPINDGVERVEFDAVEMRIESVTAADGTGLAYDYADNKLRIRLPQPLKAGEDFTAVIVYECRPRRGLYFNLPDEGYPHRPTQIWTQGEDEDNRHWFPCFDYPNEKQTSEVHATVPENFFALSNGVLEGVDHDAGARTKTYHWRQNIPHVAYLVSLVAGEFSEVRDDSAGLPVLYYQPPGREEDAKRAFGRTPQMIRFFSEKIGVPYPYEKYATVAVADFIFGGMENTSATTMTDRLLHDERAHPDLVDACDSITAHELAHQWFGDLLTTRDWANAWLNEGFATYFEALFTEWYRGHDEFVYQVLGDAETYFSEDRERYRRPIVTNVYGQPIDLFDRHLYEKGSLVLHMVRYLLGDDLWWKAINHYVRKFAQQNVTTADFARAIEEATGRNLDWFFDQYVYKQGYPEFKVSYSWDDALKSAQVKVEQTQPVNDQTPLFRMPVEIAFKVGANKQSFKVSIEEKEQSFYFALAEKPRVVSFDPNNWVLKTVDFSKGKEQLLQELKESDAIIDRIRAAEGLGKTGTTDVVEALKEALLTDPFWGVRSRIARVLGTIRSSAARDALIAGLQNEDPRVRRAVVAALGEFRGDEMAADALLPHSEHDASYFVEGEAAKSLGRIRSTRAFGELERTLTKKYHDALGQYLAFEGFAELRDERAIPLAKEWSRYGKPQRARESAVSALGKLGGLSEEKSEDAIDFLIPYLDDPWLQVRLRTVRALRELKATKALSHLHRVAESDPDGRTQRAAKEAIQAIREGTTKEEEVKKLRDDLEKLREENRELRDRLDKLERRMAAAPVT